ncbi:MAG: ribonuclease J [Myxococcaceae bacterium]
MTDDLPRLRIAALGGLGEFGLNTLSFDCEGELLLVDCGLMFPGPELPGVGLVLPDFTFLRENRDRLRGVVLTHGHEDHLGGLPYLLREVKVPVFGTRLSLALARHRLDECGVSADLREISPGTAFTVGSAFTLEAVAMGHSIPDGVGLAIRTAAGLVVHSGDFKLDEAPPDSHPTDLPRLRALGDEGVLCLFSDSTNAELAGSTGSERSVALALARLATPWQGRVVFSMFASNLARVQQVLELAARLERKVALIGRSMLRNVELATAQGLIAPPKGVLIGAGEAAGLPPSKVALLATGSQAEPRSGLFQLSGDDAGELRLRRGDLVILSARTIPGNERAVGGLIDRLLGLGAKVAYSANEPGIHVSGHAARDEQRRLIEALRPRHFVPLHGERRQLQAHLELAAACGVPTEGLLLARDGDLLEFKEGRGSISGRVPAGRVFLDKWSGSPLRPEALEERRVLAETGVVVAVVVLDRASGRLLHGPGLQGRGLSADELAALPRAAEDARSFFLEVSPEMLADDARVREELTRAVRRAFRPHTSKRPTVLPVVVKL